MNKRFDFLRLINLDKGEFLKYFSFTFACYVLPLIAIGLSNYPYFDDTWRRAMGYTGFGHDYSRWGSEFLSWLIQGSRHLVDTGLTNYVLVALILSLASLILVTTISRISFWSLFASIIIGLNPWFLGAISFKFDAPFMAISVLASVFPFLFWKDKKFVWVSVLSLFLMYNTYQASAGLFLVIFLIKIYKELIEGKKWQSLGKSLLLGGFSFLLPTILYYLQLKIFPVNPAMGQNTAVSANVLSQLLRNVYTYLDMIRDNSAKVWIVIFACLILSFVVTELFKSKVNPIQTVTYLVLLLIFGSILSVGLYLFLGSITVAPRYIYGFPFFITCLSLVMLDGRRVRRSFVLTSTGKIIATLFSFFILQFSFVYAGVLTNQREALQLQTTQLADSIDEIDFNDKNVYFSENLFSDSRVLRSAQQNYPILKSGFTQLLISNSASTESFINHQIMQNLYQNVPLGDTNFETNALTPVQGQNIADGKAKKISETNRWAVYSFENEVYIVADQA
ncbi:MAG: glucosyltransferase domain-containing protein [Streptococcaceae bacterium]|jgi:hypothetical protein|nr:glucosyltransferase domain-containing protein [Streptococcaceae bacterium]